ncbi:MAG: chromosomal replication initiator protein DnaA, partial [Burkholderia sp.]|nr:chromosomal replication initiator protein DnaA [Burkholderia sp.]
MNEFWQHCSALLERELTPQQYVTWIKPLAPVAFDAAANTLSIAAPNRFKLDWVKSQFSGRIADMARDFWQAPVDVQFVLDPKAGMRAPAAAAPAAARPASAPNSMGGSAGNAAAVDAAVGAVQAVQATRANGPNSANSAMANLNANARAAAEHSANARAAAEDAADLD